MSSRLPYVWDCYIDETEFRDIFAGRVTIGRLDSATNILANKITALTGREEPKDFADVWGFCCQMDLSISDAIEDAHSRFFIAI